MTKKPLPLPPAPPAQPSADPLGPLLDTPGAARLLGIAAGTLTQWRNRNQGPPYMRLGENGETIRYRVADIHAYAAANTVSKLTLRPKSFVNTDKIAIEAKYADRQQKRRRYMREYMTEVRNRKKLEASLKK